MATVGVLEDDPGVRQVLRRALGTADHRVVLAHDGGEAMRLFTGAELDVLVLDIGLPDADGRDVCGALRASGQDAPVLFLTALDDVEDRISGFHAGADDYLTKPFDVRELLVRVDALARRRVTGPATATGEAAGAGAPTVLRLDPTLHAVRWGERSETLTPTEYRLLTALLTRPGEVVRRHTALNAGWPDGSFVSENTLDAFIRRLRVKLERLDSEQAIHTVRGVGFVVR